MSGQSCEGLLHCEHALDQGNCCVPGEPLCRVDRPPLHKGECVTTRLPINLIDLLRQGTVEGERIEQRTHRLGSPPVRRSPGSADECSEWADGSTAEDLVVLSVPAPDRSIKMDDLRTGRAVSRRYRNRRVGAFPKELDLAEGRSTGITRIREAVDVRASVAWKGKGRGRWPRGSRANWR